MLPGFFRSTIEGALPFGHVYRLTAAGQLAGAGVWFPPLQPEQQEETPWRSRAALIPTKLVFHDGLTRLLAGFERLGEHHPNLPHWYLAFVGIAPSRQGHGLGARLLAPVLNQADMDGHPCYLETPFPQTHAFYQRLGFEPVAELRVFDAAPAVVTFLRKPKADGV